MNSSSAKILYRKAALIFEELGFLMPRSDSADAAQEARISAAVHFNGPFSGCLIVSVAPSMLPQLAANMLGEAEQANELMERDSLGEIANVICGNALPAIYGFEPVFHLDAPTILENAATLADQSGYAKEAEVQISFDTGNAMVTLLVESRAAASAAG
ncbi:MAG: chemotaxis protein CheX [Acidobacteriota bacterium]|jgi:CheY-specific phosphatase CheX|nr:chemotaxis protein CheX [Acidobacteriota bacterium]